MNILKTIINLFNPPNPEKPNIEITGLTKVSETSGNNPFNNPSMQPNQADTIGGAGIEIKINL